MGKKPRAGPVGTRQWLEAIFGPRRAFPSDGDPLRACAEKKQRCTTPRGRDERQDNGRPPCNHCTVGGL